MNAAHLLALSVVEIARNTRPTVLDWRGITDRELALAKALLEAEDALEKKK